jgi:hypothetical protein
VPSLISCDEEAIRSYCGDIRIDCQPADKVSSSAWPRDSKKPTSEPGLSNRGKALIPPCWALAGKDPEVVHHVHLVIVAEVVGDVRPGALIQTRLRF